MLTASQSIESSTVLTASGALDTVDAILDDMPAEAAALERLVDMLTLSSV